MKRSDLVKGLLMVAAALLIVWALATVLDNANKRHTSHWRSYDVLASKGGDRGR